jgi:hypothetical protein
VPLASSAGRAGAWPHPALPSQSAKITWAELKCSHASHVGVCDLGHRCRLGRRTISIPLTTNASSSARPESAEADSMARGNLVVGVAVAGGTLRRMC